MKTQDPKYDIENGRLVNAVTREPIPEDEPIFILRGKDVHVHGLLRAYAGVCGDKAHSRAVHRRADQFRAFSEAHPERMKEPDTVIGRPQEPKEPPGLRIDMRESMLVHLRGLLSRQLDLRDRFRRENDQHKADMYGDRAQMLREVIQEMEPQG